MKKPFGLLIAAIFIWLIFMLTSLEMGLIQNHILLLFIYGSAIIFPILYIFLTLLLSAIYREWFVKYWFTILLLLILILTILTIFLIRI